MDVAHHRLRRALDRRTGAGLIGRTGIKLLQRNWIGRSEGAEVAVRDSPSTNAIDHAFSPPAPTRFMAPPTWCSRRRIPGRSAHNEGTNARRSPTYKAQVSAKSDLERTDLAKEKTGVFTGAFAINPANSERIPIWIADYVLMGYGTGAIMGVPAHDERDLEFARKFDLPIIAVVQAAGQTPEASIGFIEDGIAINSPLIDGSRDPGGKRAHHQSGSSSRVWPPHRPLQVARLAFLPAALLGRAVPDRLARWQTRGASRSRNCRWSLRRSMISSRPARASRRSRGRGIGSATRKRRRAR